MSPSKKRAPRTSSLNPPPGRRPSDSNSAFLNASSREHPLRAHRGLEAEPELGVLVPCNVVIYQDNCQTHIAVVDAEQMLSIVGNDELAPPATEVRRRLAAVGERMTFGPTGDPAARANLQLQLIGAARSPVRFGGFVRMTSSSGELRMCT